MIWVKVVICSSRVKKFMFESSWIANLSRYFFDSGDRDLTLDEKLLFESFWIRTWYKTCCLSNYSSLHISAGLYFDNARNALAWCTSTRIVWSEMQCMKVCKKCFARAGKDQWQNAYPVEKTVSSCCRVCAWCSQFPQNIRSTWFETIFYLFFGVVWFLCFFQYFSRPVSKTG